MPHPFASLFARGIVNLIQAGQAPALWQTFLVNCLNYGFSSAVNYTIQAGIAYGGFAVVSGALISANNLIKAIEKEDVDEAFSCLGNLVKNGILLSDSAQEIREAILQGIPIDVDIKEAIEELISYSLDSTEFEDYSYRSSDEYCEDEDFLCRSPRVASSNTSKAIQKVQKSSDLTLASLKRYNPIEKISETSKLPGYSLID